MGIRSDGATSGKDDSYPQGQGVAALNRTPFRQRDYPYRMGECATLNSLYKQHKILRQPAAVLPIDPNKADQHS
jgi:hypothetical protein